MICNILKKIKLSTIFTLVIFIIFIKLITDSIIDSNMNYKPNGPCNDNQSGQNTTNDNNQTNANSDLPHNGENQNNIYNENFNFDSFQMQDDFNQTTLYNNVMEESSDTNLVFDSLYFFNRPDNLKRKYDAEDFEDSYHTNEFFLPEQDVGGVDFSIKLQTLQNKISRIQSRIPFCRIKINRNDLLNDSKMKINNLPASNLKNKLTVDFENEPGIDAGGLRKEWFDLVIKEALNCDLGYFFYSHTDSRTIRPSMIGKTVDLFYKDFYKFVGKLIGLAIINDCKIDAKFDRPVFKYLLNKEFKFEDLKEFDRQSYNSLSECLESEDIEYLYLTFVHGYGCIEDNLEIQLISDGDEIAVTKKNLKSYIRIKTEMILYGLIKDQLDLIKEGLYEIVRVKDLMHFTAEEFETILCGEPFIDISDWKENTIYTNCLATDLHIQWFWRAVVEFSEEDRKKLLQFVTGSDKVPYGGFANLTSNGRIVKFEIHTISNYRNRLPSSHTCFNKIDLPIYDSYENLKEKLSLAINECNTGYGLV